MIRHYKRKVFSLLAIMLVIFLAVFLLSLNSNIVFFDVGLPNRFQNNIIAFFSFLCVIFIIWDMVSA